MELTDKEIERYLRGLVVSDDIRMAIEEAIKDPEHWVWLRAKQLAVLSELMAGDDMPFDDMHQGEPAMKLTISRADLKKSLGALATLAAEQASIGKLDVALRIRQRLLKLALVHYGENDRDTLTFANATAKSYYENRDYENAAILYESVVENRSRVMGANHADTAFSMTGLGRTLEMLSDFHDAAILHERALGIVEATFGPSHPETGTALNDLGCSLTTIGEYRRAKDCFERALAISVEFDGPTDRNTGIVLGNLAGAQRQHGDVLAARQSLEKAMEVFTLCGAPLADLAWAESQLISIFTEEGEFEGAKELGLNVLAKIEMEVIDPIARGSLLNLMGVVSLNAGDYEESSRLFGQASSEFASVLGSDHICNSIVRSNSDATTGKVIDWEPLLVEAGTAAEGGRAKTVQLVIEGRLYPIAIALAV